MTSLCCGHWLPDLSIDFTTFVFSLLSKILLQVFHTRNHTFAMRLAVHSTVYTVRLA